MIKIILTYNQKTLRDEIKHNLDFEKETKVIGEADNPTQLIQILQETTPDVILMDIRQPIIDGWEVARLIKHVHPHIKVIILTTVAQEDYIFKALRNGADGYLLIDSDFSSIINGIKAAYHGALPIDPQVTPKLVNAFNTLATTKQSRNIHAQLLKLTKRELDVVQLVAQGRNNKTISELLFITEGTVKNYVTRILSKLELNSRTELALYANEALKGLSS